MRQRRVTGIEERLSVYADLILKPDTVLSQEVVSPAKTSDGHQLRWYQRGSLPYTLPEGYERIYAEVGCGRGLFINTLAAADPSGLYIGIEGCKTIVIRALAKTRKAALPNLRYIDEFVNDANAVFGEGRLSGIFLNFSDPWPKERHADRRLTAPKYATAYFRTLASGGFSALKTDSEDLFDYSLKTFVEAGFRIIRAEREVRDDVDVFADCAFDVSDIAARAAHTPTEYEQKFRALGRPVYYFFGKK